MKVLITIIIVAFLSGCGGTLESRVVGEKSDFVGGYPYDAVAFDIKNIGHESSGTFAPFAFDNATSGFLILSLPLDIAIDTVFLPIDLVTWSLGCHKSK